MFSNYSQALCFMQSTAHLGSVPGLARLQALLSRLGHPERQNRYIHVAGTNGKGSVCAMTASILQAAGYRVGLFTSPFLRDVREQIQCNGEMISPSSYMHLASRIAALGLPAESLPTEFELTTALAFLYFAEQKCDVVVLETGLGGAEDATNVIPAPLVATITRIGLDHMQFLGSSLADIAAHKAGILKKGCQAVCYPQASEAQQVIDDVCKQRQIPCVFPNFSELEVHSKGLDGQWFMYKGQGPYALSLLGPHQCKNAAIALEIIRCLRRQGFVIPEAALTQGLCQVQWPARLEVLCSDPLFLLDGGHNLQCIQAVCQALDALLQGQKIICLFGVMRDKEYPTMLQALAPYVCAFVGVQPSNARALPLEALGRALAKTGIPYTLCDSIQAGVHTALSLSETQKAPICALGSLYMAGDIRQIIYEEKEHANSKDASL